MRYGFLGLFLFVAALLVTKLAFAQPPTFQPAPYTYRIDSAGCKFAPIKRRQTGFRVKGIKGIVTALHGVADCTDQPIKAYADNDATPDAKFETLRIVAVDIDRDVALLSSDDLQALPAEGWVAPKTIKLPLGRLTFYGYPYAITYQQPTTQITVTYSMTLSHILPGQLVPPTFVTRSSPNPAIRVFYAEAHLAPGFSGAPVVQTNRQVIGVVDGGFEEKGEAGKGWLIPWSDIQWQPLYDTNGRLNPKLQAAWTKLLANNPKLSLGFLSTFPVQPVTTAGNMKYIGLVTDKRAKLPIAGARVILMFAQTGEQLVDYTDSDGIYSFQFPADADRTDGRIYIRAEGYGAVDYHVTLQPNPSERDFRLVALPPTSIPTSTFTLLPTATATATTTPTPLPTPTLGYPCLAKIKSDIGASKVDHIHKEPSSTSRKRAALAVGTTVEIRERSHGTENLYHVWSIEGTKPELGWVAPEYVTTSPACPP